MFANFVIKSKTKKVILNSSKVCMSGQQKGQDSEVKSETKVYATCDTFKSTQSCKFVMAVWIYVREVGVFGTCFVRRKVKDKCWCSW